MAIFCDADSELSALVYSVHHLPRKLQSWAFATLLIAICYSATSMQLYILHRYSAIFLNFAIHYSLFAFATSLGQCDRLFISKLFEFYARLWIWINFNLDQDLAFQHNPDLDTDQQSHWIWIQYRSGSTTNLRIQFFSKFLNYKLKVKSNGSLYYFILFNYKSKTNLQKVLFFLTLLPMAPDPDSECGTGSTKLKIESESNPEFSRMLTLLILNF
jgi:hypothetical protein